jgi:hypothetical protein
VKEMEDKNKCNLEVVCKDGSVECRAICLPKNPSMRCCKYCDEINSCNGICGFMKYRKGEIK